MCHMDKNNKIDGVLVNGEPLQTEEKSVEIPDAKKSVEKYFDEIRAVAGIVNGLDIMESIAYCNYRREGNDEAAKEILLDKIGEINAIFEEILVKNFKKD